MERTKIEKRLLYVLFVFLLAPMVQQYLQVFHAGPLKGGFRDAGDSAFTLPKWFNGDYQYEATRFLNDRTGFRPDLVRINNQIDYSLFGVCHSGWTEKGRNNNLYQRPYVHAWFGTDYAGDEIWHGRALRLKAIQDTLARLGKTLIIAYLPSKAEYWPHDFPPKYDGWKRGKTNSGTMRRLADSLGIAHQVDLNEWFVSMRGKMPDSLFTKQGIHWTLYGAIMGGDSLVRYMEHVRGRSVQHPVWTKKEYTTELRMGDADVAEELNLIVPIATERVTYPIIEEVPDDTSKKFDVVYIGDSYAHKMIEFGIVYKMNNQCEFWRYFDEMHDINGHKFTYIREYKWVEAMEKAECVVLAYTLFNFWQLGNGFIEQAYDHYYPNSPIR
jgi:hypothetical protein